MKPANVGSKKLFQTVVVILVSFVIAEGVGRIYWYHHLLHQRTAYSCTTTEAPLYIFDREVGYSYVPNSKLHLTLYDEQNRPLRTNKVIVNDFGQLSFDKDPMQRWPTEFTIAVIGDSFTATTPSDITWPTLLERDLNQDDALKKAIRKASFRVMNFGLDGTGFVQWPSVYKYKVQSLHPDLVIVNFISTDIERRFFYRNTVTIGNHDQAVVTCTSLPANLSNPNCANAYLFVLSAGAPNSNNELTQFKREMRRDLLARLPWFSVFPQMPGVLLNGRFGFHSRLQVESGGTPLFGSSQEALANSRKALETIASAQRPLLVLYHPVLQECLTKQMSPIAKEFLEEESHLNIRNMLDTLPLNSTPDEIRSWYNVPYDQHPSDYGAGIYARAVQKTISEFLLLGNGSRNVY